MTTDYFCRFCEAPMNQSSAAIECVECGKPSVPLCEEDITISVSEVKSKIDADAPFFLLDVRMQNEYDFARIEGSTLIPLPELPTRLSEIPKDKEIVVYCRTGGRSRKATLILLSSGYPAVKNMLGGIYEWSHAIDPSVPRY